MQIGQNLETAYTESLLVPAMSNLSAAFMDYIHPWKTIE